MFVYDLPYDVKKKLCSLLDEKNRFEELATIHMQYDTFQLQSLRREFYRGNSPSEELLILWGQQNHTILELYFLLNRMKHFQAMTLLTPYIDPKYQRKEPDLPDLASLYLTKKPLNNRIPSNENNEMAHLAPPKAAPPKPKSPLLLHRTHHAASDISVVAESAGTIPLIAYDDLQKSTNNWDARCILGRGGFGTVYLGTWKCTQVAIKRIEQKNAKNDSHYEQIKQSMTELHCLNAYRHDNVLPLYGYSMGGAQPCLVYQFMPGRCLEHRLRLRANCAPLSWPKRLNIATGTARGLQFLHTVLDSRPLVHGDIKSANILLDANDEPRIGDFGLAREGPEGGYTYIKVSRIQGTEPYLPDEFKRANKFSTKVDTYSFGVVLFEIGTGLGVYSETRKAKYLKEYVVEYEGDMRELKDGRAEGGEGIYGELMAIGIGCVRRKARERPEMVQVLEALEKVAQNYK